MCFCCREYSYIPFQTDLGFDWITLPFHHLGCIGVSQNSIGRLNVELRQSLSADINTESLGLCVGESFGGMGIFKVPGVEAFCHLNARSCGADREGSQLLERVEGAVTRDLENKKQVGYFYFQSMMRMLIILFLPFILVRVFGCCPTIFLKIGDIISCC